MLCIGSPPTITKRDMERRRKLTAHDRGRAIGWIEDGNSFREVSRRLNMSLSVVQRLYERFQATGSTEERPRTGRRRCTTIRDDRYLRLSALRDRTVTATRLQHQLRVATDVNVSRQTLRNRLHEAGLHSRTPATRLSLTRAHRQARLNWSRRHQRWNRQRWDSVLFTDESRFTLSHCDARMRVWRRSGERFTNACVQQRQKHGGGS